MGRFATLESKAIIEAEGPFDGRIAARTIYEFLSETERKFPQRNSVSFQIRSGPKDKAETHTWSSLKAKVSQTANLLRKLGVGESDVVAYVLPNCNETVISFLAGSTAGIVCAVNPLLDPEQISSILDEVAAKVVVTLAPFPKTDVNDKVMRAVAVTPCVETVLEVDLNHYLSPPISWIAPLLKPKRHPVERVKVLDFNKEIATQNSAGLDFEESGEDRIAAYFHTGGTTGMPKVAQHRYSGMMYNGWVTTDMLLDESDVLMCPLPMFHVLAAYPMLMSCIAAGAHCVMPTPQGYRGEGVFDNLWKLIERYKATFLVGVPTAFAQMVQRPVNADVSSLSYAISGSAPLPVELFKQFQNEIGITLLEGYGMTEATCLVSVNPPHGEKKIGSVGLPFAYTDVKILLCEDDGTVIKECATNEVGEICVNNPGVIVGGTYTDDLKNRGLFAGDYLRTGDLGRIDEDGYIWITGRAKDVIIRGGHNIDPAVIEEALAGHPAVAMSAAIGQPDIHSGELPCAYVELKQGKETTSRELMEYLHNNVGERAAEPKYIEILPELPKTGVGKIFKPDLRKMAITRVYNEALEQAGVAADVVEVEDVKNRGLVAKVRVRHEPADADAINQVLGGFARPWEMAD